MRSYLTGTIKSMKRFTGFWNRNTRRRVFLGPTARFADQAHVYFFGWFLYGGFSHTSQTRRMRCPQWIKPQ